jgi:hypothetical protein
MCVPRDKTSLLHVMFSNPDIETLSGGAHECERLGGRSNFRKL